MRVSFVRTPPGYYGANTEYDGANIGAMFPNERILEPMGVVEGNRRDCSLIGYYGLGRWFGPHNQHG
jgi:hypothetical protein